MLGEVEVEAAVPTQESKRRVPTRAWAILLAAVAAQTGISIVDQGLTTLVGFMKTDMQLSASRASLVISAFLLGRCLASYGAGVAADTIGERLVLIAGGVLTGTLVALTATASDELVYVCLFAAGLCSSVATPAGGRLVLTSFPRDRQGFALGVRQTAVPGGGLLAAATLPWIASGAGWRWALAAAGAIAAASILPLLAIRRERRPATLPVEEARYNPFRDRNIRLLTIWASLFVSGQYALIAFLALDVNERMGIGLAHASLFVVIAQAAGIAGRIGWGAISDRTLARGRKPLLLALTAAGIAGVAALFATPDSAPPALVAAVAFLTGFGVIGFQGLFITMLADAAGPRHVGAATGFSVTFVQLTIVVSSPLYGLVADQFESYRAIWGALTVILLVAAIPAALVRERPASDASPAPGGGSR